MIGGSKTSTYLTCWKGRTIIHVSWTLINSNTGQSFLFSLVCLGFLTVSQPTLPFSFVIHDHVIETLTAAIPHRGGPLDAKFGR